MSKNLVIVESPAKAKTISKFLGRDYTVMASMGHVRDLPKSKIGFDPQKDFKPQYLISPDKRKVIADLKKRITKNTVIYLAADEDREGEAIAWHLIPALKIEKNPIKRIVFHEITKEAILNAIKNPREVNQNLVDAQQARRILDRAVGYKLSPLLWKKIRYGLSAGRVQSVATRLIVDKEQEIRDFKPQEYWKIKVSFKDPKFVAELNKENGKVIKVTNQQKAKDIELSLKGGIYKLIDIEQKESKRTPPPPFTTSTLQQEASRKLGLSVKQTMVLAQQLYEGNFDIPNHTGGLITYMRTDSLNLSNLALTTAKEVILKDYGKDYALSKPRVYKSKSKGAQEAHEAIRPVDLHLKPSAVKDYLDYKVYRLYELIYKRTIATQMSNVIVANTTYKIEAGINQELEFVAKGQKIIFSGFMKAYIEGNDNPTSALENMDKLLPDIKLNKVLDPEKLDLEQLFTKPPSRYTEASLVKKLESEGIGRPSTYAPTISTIQQREYVVKTEDKKLAPTEIGEVVNSFLVEHFSDIVDIGFTAKVEEEFDEIAQGKIAWQEVMKEFYFDFAKTIDDKEKSVQKMTSPVRLVGIDPKTNQNIYASVGRYGPFVQLGDKDEDNPEKKPKFASIPENKDFNTITVEEAMVLFELPRVIGEDENGNDIKVNIGRFGPYIQIKSTYYSLKTDDPYTIELPRALEIIKEQNEAKQKALIQDFPVQKIQILDGKYGAYIKKGRKNYKIPKSINPKTLPIEDVLKIIEKEDKLKGKKK